MKIIFMGTPDFATETLEALIADGQEIALVVTQPDKPKGRGKAMQSPPVKAAAQKHNLEVYQPKRIREKACVEYLKTFEVDFIVVVAFGQILPKEILDLPKYCCINVHASLLPKYRGAAPIQWAVIHGEKISGVTTMRMDEGLDTGDMIMKQEVPLEAEETGGSLFDKLAETGASLCVQTLHEIVQGTAVYTPQNHADATHTTMINKQMGNINFEKTAVEIERLIRGLNPWPSAYTQYGDKTLKIWKASVIEKDVEVSSKVEPGTVILVTKDSLLVQTGQGQLALCEVQLEGKKRMDIAAFLRGNPVKEGEYLGNSQAK